MMDCIGIMLCFKTEGMTRTIYTAAFSNAPIIDVVSSIKVHTRHCGVNTHSNSGQIGNGYCCRPERTCYPVNNIIMIVAACL